MTTYVCSHKTKIFLQKGRTGHSSQQKDSLGYRDSTCSLSSQGYERRSLESGYRRQPCQLVCSCSTLKAKLCLCLMPSHSRRCCCLNNVRPRFTCEDCKSFTAMKILRMNQATCYESTIFWTAKENFCQKTC